MLIFETIIVSSLIGLTALCLKLGLIDKEIQKDNLKKEKDNGNKH